MYAHTRPPGDLPVPLPHLLAVAQSAPTQLTSVLSTYLQGFRCPPTVCSGQVSPSPTHHSEPEVQQTQRWLDRGAGAGGAWLMAQALSCPPQRTHT